MKLKNIFVVLSLFLFLQSYGQFNFTDVVYLKNGSIIRGIIIEQIPNQSIKIQTNDRNVFVFKYDEIEKISKEEAKAAQTIVKVNTPREVNSDTINRVNYNGLLFINFSLGYAGNAARQTIDNSYSNNVYNTVAGSFGKGLLTNLRIGYKVSNVISFDLGMSYLIGGKIIGNSVSTSSNSQREWHASIFNLNPAISISHSKKSVGIYARAGILIGLATKLINDFTSNYNSGSSSYINKVQKTEYSGGLPFGFSNSIGITYSLSSSLCIVSELNLFTQNWAPKKAVITEYKLDGVDKLYSLPNKETTFVDSYNTSSSANTVMKTYLPLSSISFNLGLKVNL